MRNSEIMQQYLPTSAANDCHMHPRKNYSVCPTSSQMVHSYMYVEIEN